MNQFERLELLIGKNNIDKIQNATVLIIGLGGVGSYATEALIRSGIKKIILVDNDKIDITNLNRQLMTNYENIGKFKTEELKKRIQSINKFIEVKCITKFIDKTNIDELFKEKIDYVIDACDTVSTKKEIIKTKEHVLLKFLFVGILMVIVSIFLTLIVNLIADKNPNVASSFIGAILLGITTSMPEVITFIALIKMKSFDLALSDIIGSNLFNLLILAIGDIFLKNKEIYYLLK